MKVDLDLFEMSWLLESCLRGSHLRSGTIDRFIDDWYWRFSGTDRARLHEWVLRLVYDGNFKPMQSMCGADVRFMARYDPDNQYELEVTTPDSKRLIRAFRIDGTYCVNSSMHVDPDMITSVRKLTKSEAEAETPSECRAD